MAPAAWRAGLLSLLLAPMLAVLAGTLLAPAASASVAQTVSVSCLPQPDQQGCIAGTLGGRNDPVEGADLTLVDEAGTEGDTVTTGEDGKFAFTITEPGAYTVRLDEETLSDDFELLGPAEVSVNVNLGANAAAFFEIRPDNFEAGGSSRGERIVQGVANGLKLGLLLALASLGLSLIYGTTGLSNFAHAEQVTLGGVVAYGLVNVGGMNLWLGIVVTVLICGATGYLQDRVLWQPLRRRGLGLTQMVIVTIGMALAAQYAFQYFIGASNQKVVVRDFGTTTIGPITVTNQSWIAMGVSIVMIALVGFVLLRTRIGQATRAVSDNPALAAASGIDVDRIIRLVWTASAALAGLAGVFYALAVSNGIRWDTGMQILLLLFAAVTLGGLGTAFGAFIGSIIIGLIVELASPLGAPGDLKYAVALVILILLLLVRPQGILGKAGRVG
ncbi:ABC transporter permease subunit [Nocardioides nanhaiensis]|uniref:SpaA-like prealbumin fold domain-containing protein n=1 Tax=Nocardioides nanhaiensis TaxID=1476871 RepID=A0ABP8WYV4_9ACTN